MAFILCKFRSEVLRKNCEMNIILPQKPKKPLASPNHLYPVVYLLHGLGGDQATWCQQTSIERYAEAYDAVIVMPNGDRSFYTDMANGHNYETMLVEELPEIVQNMFPVSPRREDTFVAGLSMGGYGALKLALSHPDRYAGAVGLSAPVDIRARIEVAKDPMRQEYARIFGNVDNLISNGHDLFNLAEKALKAPQPPKIMTACGTEDLRYDANIHFRDHMRKLNFPNYEYLEGSGAHQWSFWDKFIQPGLKFLLNDNQITQS